MNATVTFTRIDERPKYEIRNAFGDLIGHADYGEAPFPGEPNRKIYTFVPLTDDNVEFGFGPRTLQAIVYQLVALNKAL